MRLTILGGGGFRVPLVYRALLTGHRRTGITEVMLHDVDRTRLDAIGRVLAAQARDVPGAPAVLTSTDLDIAVTGASFVFCAIRVGGLRGRVIDERVALDAGVLGQETVGAGGISYGLRTVPVALRIADRIARLAPGAWTINFTNPAGLVTEAMASRLGDRVIGICDSPAGLVDRVLRTLNADLSAVHIDYAGLNHLGWLYGVHSRPAGITPGAHPPAVAATPSPAAALGPSTAQRAPGPAGEPRASGLPDLAGVPNLAGLPDLAGVPNLAGLPDLAGAPDLPAVPDPVGAAGKAHAADGGLGGGLLDGFIADRALVESIEEGRLFGFDFLHRLGAVPNEYLHYYYDPAGTLAAVRDAKQTRGAFLLDQQHRCYERIASPDRDPLDAWLEAWREREATYMAENRELAGAGEREHDESRPAGYEGVALAVMRALAHDEPVSLILNVRNQGRLGVLDDDAVIEVPCTVDVNGAVPHRVAPLPGHGIGLVQAVKSVERGVLEAVATGSRSAAVRAMATHPLVGAEKTAQRLVDAYRAEFAELAYLR